LIEMLIVVAIIGSLSTLVLTKTRGHKESGADTAVKAGLQQVITQAESYYNGNEDSFNDACDDTQISRQREKIGKNTSRSNSNVSCEADDQRIAVSAYLRSNGKQWCVDNDGYNDLGEISGSACVSSSE